MLARGGFDPPTLGLWAPRASPAPPRCTSIALLYLYKGLIIFKYLNKLINLINLLCKRYVTDRRFRSSDLWVMGPTRFLCATPVYVCCTFIPI